MTEVPEHLLQRSRERRAALGLGTGDEGGEAAPAAPAKAEAAEPRPAAAPAPAQPAAPPEPVPEPEPEPVPPVVVAAQSRPRIPAWALPVLAALPLWAILYAGVLTEHEELEDVLAMGEQVFVANCASCHGAGGRGGVAPALNDPQLLATFPDRAEQLTFVMEGSSPGVPYGEAGDVGTGGMPAWAGQLTDEEIVAVVRYEREALAGEEAPDEEELAQLEGEGGDAGDQADDDAEQ